jgi:putative addiction module component (TIGR02574 family)
MPLSLEIEESLFALPAEERCALGNRLLDSVEEAGLPGSMYPDEILAEAIRRDEELESGAVKPISHEELMGNLRRRFPFLSEH